MSYNMEMDTVSLEKIISDVDSKIANMKSIYSDIEKKMAPLDGANDIWKGKVQGTVYTHYLEMAANFPIVIEQLTAYSTFLKNTVKNYNKTETSINKDVDNNQKDLNIN